jgi:hypothetical protein
VPNLLNAVTLGSKDNGVYSQTALLIRQGVFFHRPPRRTSGPLKGEPVFFFFQRQGQLRLVFAETRCGVRQRSQAVL